MRQKLGKYFLFMIVLIFQSFLLSGCVEDNEKEIEVPMNSKDFLVDTWNNTASNYSIKTSPQNGEVVITTYTQTPKKDGCLLSCQTYAYVYYTPNTDYIGKDKIEIQLQVLSAKGLIPKTRSIKINVVGSNIPGNNKPIANDQNITIDYETETDFNITGSDADNDTLTFVIDSNTTNGTIVLVDETTGDVTYTPNQGYSGPDHFTFKVIDENNALSNIADVNITVKSKCETDPTAPGCPMDPCIVPATTPGCPGFDPCLLDPTAPGCPLYNPCMFDPLSIECEDFCFSNPSAPSCPLI